MQAHVPVMPDVASAVKLLTMLQINLFRMNTCNKFLSRLARLHRSLLFDMTVLTTTSPTVCTGNHLLLYHHIKVLNGVKLTLCVARTTVVSSCLYNGSATAALNLPGNQVLSCRSNPSLLVDSCNNIFVDVSESRVLRRSSLHSARVASGAISDSTSMCISRKVGPSICNQIYEVY